MPKITFVTCDGESRQLDALAGVSAMRAAVANGIRSIVAECGGAMMCATCHVYVAEEWIERLPPPTAEENAMLDMTVGERRSNSRLSCQIIMSEGLDGIVMIMPQRQV